MALGTGKFQYQLVPNWAKLPPGWSLDHPTDVAVDSQDRVYIFSRSAHPIIVLDRNGNLLNTWGEGEFPWSHGIFIQPDDSVYLTDGYLHQVLKYTTDGKLLKAWGTKYAPGVSYYRRPFNMPTGIAFAPNGDMFVSDGYGNRCVHKYDAAGNFCLTWGEGGEGPGQFSIVHNIGVDSKSRVYVCDRENYRIQIFDADGKYLTEWRDLNFPADVFITKNDEIFVAEIGGKKTPRISVLDTSGKVLSRWDNATGEGKGAIMSPHGIWLDSRGDMYVTELNHKRIQKFAKAGR